MSVETYLSNEFTKTWRQFGFDAHGYKCVTRNKSLRVYQTVLHYYQFFLFDRCICGLHSHLLKDVMDTDIFGSIRLLRNKPVERTKLFQRFVSP